MEKEKLEAFRAILLDQLNTLLKTSGVTIEGMSREKLGVWDEGDRASLEAHRGLILRLRDRERKLMMKIMEALRRIDEGTYGICEECGRPISEERLKARPVTTLCIDCKRDQEEEERLRGE